MSFKEISKQYHFDIPNFVKKGTKREFIFFFFLRSFMHNKILTKFKIKKLRQYPFKNKFVQIVIQLLFLMLILTIVPNRIIAVFGVRIVFLSLHTL